MCVTSVFLELGNHTSSLMLPEPVLPMATITLLKRSRESKNRGVRVPCCLFWTLQTHVATPDDPLGSFFASPSVA